ncbi:uncharacterized protein LOC135927164 isoform X2 [Gordionus sp. m RMFG-2023]|uniref:uncharacterized protein LOC135927164 isoform X2 n=1 Tax=Gordionus sp. m RMFG-2023 TaxID=3053472 RepID=UPI0031FBE876
MKIISLSTFAIYNSSIHLIYGIYLFGISTSCIIFHYPISIIGAGFWTGLLFLIEGLLGLYIKRKGEEDCFVVTFLSISIISVITSTCILIFAILGIYCEIYRKPVSSPGILETLSQPKDASLNGSLTMGMIPLDIALSADRDDQYQEIKVKHFNYTLFNQKASKIRAIRETITTNEREIIYSTRTKNESALDFPPLTKYPRFNDSNQSATSINSIIDYSSVFKYPPTQRSNVYVINTKNQNISDPPRAKRDTIMLNVFNYSITLTIYVIAVVLSIIDFCVSLLSAVVCCKAAFGDISHGSTFDKIKSGRKFSIDLKNELGPRGSGSYKMRVVGGKEERRQSGISKLYYQIARSNKHAQVLPNSISLVDRLSKTFDVKASERGKRANSWVPLLSKFSGYDHYGSEIARLTPRASYSQHGDELRGPSFSANNNGLPEVIETLGKPKVPAQDISYTTHEDVKSPNTNMLLKRGDETYCDQRSPASCVKVLPSAKKHKTKSGIGGKCYSKVSGKSFLNPFKLTLQSSQPCSSDDHSRRAYLDIPSYSDFSSSNKTGYSYVAYSNHDTGSFVAAAHLPEPNIASFLNPESIISRPCSAPNMRIPTTYNKVRFLENIAQNEKPKILITVEEATDTLEST